MSIVDFVLASKCRKCKHSTICKISDLVFDFLMYCDDRELGQAVYRKMIENCKYYEGEQK